MYSDRFTVFDPKNFLKKKRILFIEHSIYTYKLFLDSFMKHVGDQFEFITSNSPVLNNIESEKTIKKWIHPENIFDESLFKTIYCQTIFYDGVLVELISKLMSKIQNEFQTVSNEQLKKIKKIRSKIIKI